jgi:hypothetical protein
MRPCPMWTRSLEFYKYYALVLYVLALAILVARWKLFRNSSYRVDALDGLMLAAIIFAISALVIPDASSTGAVYIASRISLFSSLMLVAWIVSQLANLLPRLEGRISTTINCAGVVAVVSAACVVGGCGDPFAGTSSRWARSNSNSNGRKLYP